MEKSGVSLEKKVKRIAVCAGAVVFFSIGANLADDPEVRKRLLSFASMSGKKFFREVQSRLSPEELEEYLEENPEERIYLMTPPHK